MKGWITLALVCWGSLALAQTPTDDVPITEIVWHQSPDVRDWPITKRLALIELSDRDKGRGVRRVLSPYVPQQGADPWPDFVPPGWDGPLRDTLWLIVRCGDGRWHGAAVIEYWHSREWTGAPLLTDYHEWMYFWDAENRCAPTRGDRVGFMVTSGQVRLNKGIYGRDANGAPVRQRSNLRLVTLVENATTEFQDANPTPTPVDPTPPSNVAALTARVDALELALGRWSKAFEDLSAEHAAERAQDDLRWQTSRAERDAWRAEIEESLKSVVIPMRCRARADVGFARIPISCTLE